MAKKLPNPKDVIDQDKKSRTPRTKLGAWISSLGEDERAWFWELMESAYFDGEYGAEAALALARPHMTGMPVVSDNAARRFLYEQRPAGRKGASGRSKRA